MQPRWPETSAADRADLAECAALLRGGSRSFHAASLLLPGRVRHAATALYAFCRIADDAIDLEAEPAGRVAALARLAERLDHAYRGRPLPAAADRALAHAVVQFAIPRTLLDALLDGFAWDAEGRRYESLADLLDYAARVAGTVGAMMAAIMGARSPAAVARACDLGVAMQLSNIARDVGEDARAGRLYLPLEWLRAAGIAPDTLLGRPVASPVLAGVVRQLLAEADRLYARAAAGIGLLPQNCRPGIRAAGLLYAAIGDEVRRLPDMVAQRAVVPGRRKAWLLARSMLPGAGAALLQAPPLPATQFLVDAVVAATPRSARSRSALPERMIWVLHLFERLERGQVMQGRS